MLAVNSPSHGKGSRLSLSATQCGDVAPGSEDPSNPSSSRRSSLMDRRPNFSSTEGVPKPLITLLDETGNAVKQKLATESSGGDVVRADADIPSSADVAGVAIGRQSLLSSSRGTTDMASTVAAVSTRSTRRLNSFAGRCLGNSFVAMEHMVRCYVDVVTPLALQSSAATNDKGGMNKGSAPPPLPAVPLIEASLRSLTPEELLQHCLHLHHGIQQSMSVFFGPSTNMNLSVSQSSRDAASPPPASPADAVGSQSSPVQQFLTTSMDGRSVSQTFPSEPVSATVSTSFSVQQASQGTFTLAPPLTASVGVAASQPFAPETPAAYAALHHSISTMSMNVEPVQVTREARRSVDEDGSKMINDYVVLDTLGRGNFGKVKLAFDTHNCRTVAIKIVRKPPLDKLQKMGWVAPPLASPCRIHRQTTATRHAREVAPPTVDDDMALRRKSLGMGMGERHQMEALQREIAVMKKLRHKNIVSLYEVIDDPEAEKLYLVMQYIDDGPIGSLSADGLCASAVRTEAALLSACNQILAGLQYLHTRGIVHRDIKPENILRDKEGGVFLADFGVSEFFAAVDRVDSNGTTTTTTNMNGTRLFMAPELFSQQNVDGAPRTSSEDSGWSVDMWALGVSIYALLTGSLPFHTVDEVREKNIEELLQGGEEKEAIGVPPLWRPILAGLLDRNASLRCSAHSVRQRIKAIVSLYSEISDDAVDDVDDEDDNDECGGATPHSKRAMSFHVSVCLATAAEGNPKVADVFKPISASPPLRHRTHHGDGEGRRVDAKVALTPSVARVPQVAPPHVINLKEAEISMAFTPMVVSRRGIAEPVHRPNDSHHSHSAHTVAVGGALPSNATAGSDRLFVPVTAAASMNVAPHTGTCVADVYSAATDRRPTLPPPPPPSQGPLNAQFKLKGATIIDLSAPTEARVHHEGAGRTSAPFPPNPTPALPPCSAAAVAVDWDALTGGGSAAPPAAVGMPYFGATSTAADDAATAVRREHHKFNRRLAELLEEQQAVDTRKLLVRPLYPPPTV